jgi:antitoxin VapB
MSLNIKNKEAYQLASEIAELTGRSMTAVVLDALRRERGQIARQQEMAPNMKVLMAIGKRCAAHINQNTTTEEHGDMLYDENGRPK